MLLEQGANPFVTDVAGKMPLDYALQQRFGKAIEKLKTAMLTRGAQLSGETPVITTANGGGDTGASDTITNGS